MYKIYLALISVFTVVSSFSQNYDWSAGFGTSGSNSCYSTVDGPGNFYITGNFQGPIDLDPGVGTSSFSTSYQDVFFAKYDNARDLIWAKAIKNVSNDLEVRKINLDATGNIYISGLFTGTVDFDPTSNLANLSTPNPSVICVFLAKYDNAGNYIFSKILADNTNNSSGSHPAAIVFDGSGNLYLLGGFTGTVDVDPSSAVATIISQGTTAVDFYFAKYDNSGNYLWSKSIGSVNDDYPYDMKLDASGNIFLTGFFRGTCDFNPGPGTANLSSNLMSEDVFLAKYDNAGNYVWAESFGDVNYDMGNALQVDPQGNVYLMGVFDGHMDMDPGPNTANISTNGLTCMFMAKYSGAGSYLWAKVIEGSGYFNYGVLLRDVSGNIYLGGTFYNVCDFDPGPGGAVLTSSGPSDLFFAKYDSNGNFIWVKNIGGPGCTVNGGVPARASLDASGGLCISAVYSGTVDVDPGPNIVAYSTNGSGGYNFFIARYSEVPTGMEEERLDDFQMSVYPNPFRESSTLRFYLNAEAPVRLTMYDTFGRQLKLLEDRKLESGTHEYKLELSSKGVYFIKLQVNNQYFTKKLVVE